MSEWDQAAWTASALQAQYRGDVFRYVHRRIDRREEAEDVTAEVFAAAFESLPKFRGRVPARLWLLGIARRKVADSLRRRERRPETLISELPEAVGLWSAESAGDGPAAALAKKDARREIRAIVCALKEEQREALLLQHVEELSLAEIAVVMGRSNAAVHSLLQRARASVYRQGAAYFVNSEVTPKSEVIR